LPKLLPSQKFNLLKKKKKTSKAAGFGQDEGTTEKYIYIETYNHKYFSGGFRCAFCVWVFLPGGIRPANAKLYNFYVWSLFFLPLLIAFPSLSCMCVGERENSLSQVKATSLLAILVIVSPNAFRVLTCLVAGIVSVSVSRELIEIRM